jgi:hypothetical protein
MTNEVMTNLDVGMFNGTKAGKNIIGFVKVDTVYDSPSWLWHVIRHSEKAKEYVVIGVDPSTATMHGLTVYTEVPDEWEWEEFYGTNNILAHITEAGDRPFAMMLLANRVKSEMDEEEYQNTRRPGLTENDADTCESDNSVTWSTCTPSISDTSKLPVAYYQNGKHSIKLTYVDGDQDTKNQQSDISVQVADYSDMPETGNFKWRTLTRKFKTLELAKAAGEKAIFQNNNFVPKELLESRIDEAMNGWAILPATMALYDRRTVDIITAASEWSPGPETILVCSKEERTGKRRMLFIASSGDAYSHYVNNIGKEFDTYHDQTGASKGRYRIDNVVVIKDDRVDKHANEIGMKEKASLSVFK